MYEFAVSERGERLASLTPDQSTPSSFSRTYSYSTTLPRSSYRSQIDHSKMRVGSAWSKMRLSGRRPNHVVTLSRLIVRQKTSVGSSTETQRSI
jgi:hypothetical protein